MSGRLQFTVRRHHPTLPVTSSRTTNRTVYQARPQFKFILETYALRLELSDALKSSRDVAPVVFRYALGLLPIFRAIADCYVLKFRRFSAPRVSALVGSCKPNCTFVLAPLEDVPSHFTVTGRPVLSNGERAAKSRSLLRAISWSHW